MPNPDRNRVIPPEVTAILGEPGTQTRRSAKSVPDSTTVTPTDVFRQTARQAISPERTAFREALPGLYNTLSVPELAEKFHVPVNEVRSDVLYLQGRGLLPRKRQDQSTENLPYEQAFARAVQFDGVIRSALEKNNQITIQELIGLLRGKLDWATEINENAVQTAWTRIKKELELGSPPPKRRKRTI